MRLSARLLTFGLAGSALVMTGAVAATSYASTGSPANGARQAAERSSEMPPTAVEDFSYPDAERILKEKDLKLKRGDGNIVLAECSSDPGQLKFIARNREDFCFKVTGSTGYLSLEVPSVGGVQSGDYRAKVEMQVGEEQKSFDVPKNSWTGIGENADPSGREHMLLEIRASK
ncbi:hypothetical protein [Streptomyces sp. NPDC048340]|uniref:hypothetical protein n=1 Tax=Streptomyces sp. NPDC048340 TaxID=3365537 RepID=UPI0037213A14